MLRDAEGVGGGEYGLWAGSIIGLRPEAMNETSQPRKSAQTQWVFRFQMVGRLSWKFKSNWGCAFLFTFLIVLALRTQSARCLFLSTAYKHKNTYVHTHTCMLYFIGLTARCVNYIQFSSSDDPLNRWTVKTPIEDHPAIDFGAKKQNDFKFRRFIRVYEYIILCICYRQSVESGTLWNTQVFYGMPKMCW